MTGPKHMTDRKGTNAKDPQRWVDEASSSPFGVLARAGAAEHPSISAKHRARAAVLLAAAGGAASAAATKAAVASTAASTSAPPVSLAASGTAGTTAGTAASSAAASGASVAAGGAGTAGAVVTGAAGLSAKFGAGSVLFGVAKWTGVSAMVAAVGFGGHQLVASGGANQRLTDPTASAAAPASSSAMQTRRLPNLAGTARSSDSPVAATEGEPVVVPQALVPELASSLAATSVTTSGASTLVAPRVGRTPRGNEQPTASSARTPSQGPETSVASSELPSSLARNQELALVDRAWSALRSGKPREALSLLDGYTSPASERQFETEALLIRLEALAQSGQHTAARTLANRILEHHQRGRLADKARQVLDRSPSTR